MIKSGKQLRTEQIFARVYSLCEAKYAQPQAIPSAVNEEFLALEVALLDCDEYELDQLVLVLSKILARMDRDYQGGTSNFLFFKVRRLLRRAQRRRGEPSIATGPIDLVSSELISAIAADKFRVGKTRVPDSAHQFLAIAHRSSFFESTVCLDWFPSTVPTLFALNAVAIKKIIAEHSAWSLSAGHCMIGVGPAERIASVLERYDRQGILIGDHHLYCHVRDVASAAPAHPIEVGISIDSDYYREKLRRRADVQSRDGLASIVDRIDGSQREAVDEILPGAIILQSNYLAELQELATLVAPFLREEVREYASTNLRVDARMTQALAMVAASYLYYPLVRGVGVLVVEAALTVEIPVRVVLPFLASLGLQHLFAYVGLLPLPDTRMSHGAMYYGDSERGKLFTSDSVDRMRDVLWRASVNPVAPHRCFFVNYYLSATNAVPDDVCHPRLCGEHIANMIDDICRLSEGQ